MLILITGSTGFLGSHLVKRLIKSGHTIIALKRDSSNLERLKACIDEIKFYNSNLGDLELVFRENPRIDIVLHCATSYGRSSDDIQIICDSNIVFPIKLLELSVKYNIKTFINTDTFFNLDITFDEFIQEKRYLQNYTLSKRQLREWGRLISSTYPLQFVNMKLEHIYGSDDSKSKFIPSLIYQCLKNKPEILLTDGMQQRDFIYIDDAVEAFILTLNALDTFEKNYIELNIGKGVSSLVKDFALKVKEITRSSSKLRFGALDYRDKEISNSKADITSLCALGWKPQFNDTSGILKYLETDFKGL